MKSSIKIVLLIFCFIIMVSNVWSQVKIGEISPSAVGASLDLNPTRSSGYKGGLLLPNIRIQDINYIPTDFTERKGVYGQTGEAVDLTGMVVYNTNENLLDDNGDELGRGVFFWDGYRWHLATLRPAGGGELPSGPDDKEEYEDDTSGNLYIKGMTCLSIQDGYDPSSSSADPSYYDKKDNLYLEGNNSPSNLNNLSQTYTVIGELNNLESIYWELAPKDYGDRNISEHIESIIFSNPIDGSSRTSTIDDGTFLTMTITYKPYAGKALEAAIAEECQNSDGNCYVRLDISVYYTYKNNDEHLIANRTVYFQNFKCCEGYLCEGCAYDYANGTPGNWAEVGVGNPNNASHEGIAINLTTGQFGTYTEQLKAAFETKSAGDLCVYKEFHTENSFTWPDGIAYCQSGDYADGREDYKWYVPNIMEVYQIYTSLGGNGTSGTGRGTSEDFDGGTPMLNFYHFSSTEYTTGSGAVTSAITFTFASGLTNRYTKSLNGQTYKYRCVRRMN